MKRWLALVVLLAACSSSGPDKTAALTDCRQAVKDKLKTPATARFDADRPADVQEIPRNASASDPAFASGALIITGTVDAQNSFGANVRNSYVCSMHLSGSAYKIRDPKSDVLLF